MRPFNLLILATMPMALLACSEYDLNRPNPGEAVTPEDTSQPPDSPPATAPDIEVKPTALDFGYIMHDCESAPQDVVISNVGDEDLVVDSVDLTGTGTVGFSYTFDSTLLPLTLAPEDSTSFEVTFKPAVDEGYAIDIQILSNDPDEAEVLVPVEGVGSEDAQYEEVFYQGEPGPADILWVADNSGSMSDEMQMVMDEFDVFISSFIDLDLDFHLGVVTTDMDLPADSGNLQGDPTYLDRTSADPESDFNQTIAEIYAVTGSGSERGLDAVYAALTEPLVSGYNAGFFRETADDGSDVTLTGIIVTDEDDDSSRSASSFASWFKGLKSDPDLVSFSAVCEYVDFGGAAFGCNKYIEVVDETGGFLARTDQADFEEVLAYLSLEAMGMSTIFRLSYVPTNIAYIEVLVNGSKVSYSAVDGWTYLSDQNAIWFRGAAVPEAAAEIRVSYPFEGGCE